MLVDVSPATPITRLASYSAIGQVILPLLAIHFAIYCLYPLPQSQVLNGMVDSRPDVALTFLD
jgi:hypothetical protein